MSNFAPDLGRNKPDPLKQRKRGVQSSEVAKPSEPQKPLFTRETVLAWVAGILMGSIQPPAQKPPAVTEPFKRGRK